MNLPAKTWVRPEIFILLLLGSVLLLLSGCGGANDTVPVDSVLTIQPIGKVAILSGQAQQTYRVTLVGADGIPLNGITVSVTGNFSVGSNINFNGFLGSSGQLLTFTQETGDQGYFDFGVSAPLSTSQLNPPTGVLASGVTVTGGLLTGSTAYDYCITAKVASPSGETTCSSITANTGTGNSIEISWNPVAGATGGYNIYGRSGSLGFLANVGPSTLMYTDDGSITTPGIAPPTNNTAVTGNSLVGWIAATVGATTATIDVSF